MQTLLFTSILFSIAFSQTCMIAGCDKSLQQQSATGSNFKCFQYNAGVSYASAKCPDNTMICSTYKDYKNPFDVITSGFCVPMGMPKQQFLDQQWRLPGDFCSNTTDCSEGSTCTSNVCVASTTQTTCMNTNQCPIGNYC